MEVSNEKIREYTMRIMKSRMRLLSDNGFYGLLLMHIKMGISDAHDTAWTDLHERIYFNPDFLETLSDREVDFVLMHEIMHIVLHHVFRMDGRNSELYNIAADIVVNSNILRSNGGNIDSITIEEIGGAAMHSLPDTNDEGWNYTVEEVYELLVKYIREQEDGDAVKDMEDKQWDYHLTEEELEAAGVDENLRHEIWNARMMQAAEAVSIRQGSKTTGALPLCVERYLKELKNPQTDWRTVLDEFIQEEINDYTLCPPDRRFDDNPFYLPDYNEKDYRVEKILFMIDTSGSMSDDEITQCYSEIKGAIDQFDGKLEGWLGFFDAEVVPPVAFEDVDELIAVRPKGGGGTRFDIIFDYVRDNMEDDYPVSIVILTDGYAPYPDVSCTLDIPVLWIINNEKMTPPWGKITRISQV